MLRKFPVPYEVHSIDQILDLIKEEKVSIVGGWKCAAGYVVLGFSSNNELDEDSLV